jgi:signal transduction histidine kinase
MTNTVKHANASEIVLNIKDMEKFLVINYSDNGMGFDQNQVKTEGMGLNNIRNRVETFGGKIFFESTPGNGVRVKIEMPVRYE